MTQISRRGLMGVGAALAGTLAAGKQAIQQASAAGGFQAAVKGGPGGLGDDEKKAPGVQNIYALCEVTGGAPYIFCITFE